MVKKKKTQLNHIEYDWQKVAQLLEAGCSGNEIAAHFGYSDQALFNACKKEFGISFSEYKRQKRSKGDSILKYTQMKKAVGGNVPLLIWLGKQRLGQRDQPVEDEKFDGKLALLLEKLLKDK